MPPEEHQAEGEGEVGPLVDGIRVIDTPRVALVRTNPTAIVVLLAGSILLATGIAFALTHFSGVQDTVQTVIPEREPARPPVVTAPRYLVVPDTNIRVLLPVDWRESRVGDTVPTGITAPRSALTHPDRACRIVYASIETATLKNEYRTGNEHIDIMRDAHFVGRIERAVPVHSTDGAEAAPPAPYPVGEIAFAYQPLFYDNGSDDVTRTAWVLFSTSDVPLDPLCIEQFEALVRSYTPHFEPVVLTRDITGVLTIEDYTDRAPEIGTVLLWRDGTGPAHLVATLDTGMINKPTLTGDTLYYVGTEGLLKVYRLIDTLPPQIVPLPLDPEATVHDFRVVDGSVEYLTGMWCVQTPESCDLVHASFDPATGTSTVHAEHVTDYTLLTTAESPSAQSVASLTLTGGTLTPGPSRFEGIVTIRQDIAVY